MYWFTLCHFAMEEVVSTSLSRWMLIPWPTASLMQQIHWGCTAKNGPHLAYLCFGSPLFNERGLDQSLAHHAFFGR